MVIRRPRAGDPRNPAGEGRARPPDRPADRPPSRDIPQLPFSHFHLHFREGGRAPLISPPGCGTFDRHGRALPLVWQPAADHDVDLPDHQRARTTAPAPRGPAPFHPGFEAGTLNNAAGRYSPFDMRLTRRTANRTWAKFSASSCRPGVVAQARRHPLLPRGRDRPGARAPGRARGHRRARCP